jgi:hypothetical protein
VLLLLILLLLLLLLFLLLLLLLLLCWCLCCAVYGVLQDVHLLAAHRAAGCGIATSSQHCCRLGSSQLSHCEYWTAAVVNMVVTKLWGGGRWFVPAGSAVTEWGC